MKLAVLVFLLVSAQTTAPEPIRVLVGPGPSLTVTIPNVNKTQLTSIVSVFFAKGNEDAEKQINAVIGKAKSVTLVVTTEK